MSKITESLIGRIIISGVQKPLKKRGGTEKPNE